MDVETLEPAPAPETASPAVIENAAEAETAAEDDEIISLDDLPAEESEGEEVEAAEGEGDGAELEADEPEFVSIELDNGETVDVHPDLKDMFMRNKDYTQKSQANAEIKRELEQQREALIQREQINQAEFDAMVETRQIQAEYANYAELTPEDWNALEAEDPIGAQQHWRNFQLLEKQWNAANMKLQQAQQEKQTLLQSEATKRWEQAENYAKANIPGWNKEMETAVRDFAADQLSFPTEQFNASVNENVLKALHLAWVGSKALANQAKAASAKAKLKPMSRVAGKSGKSAPSDPSEMSMEQYAAWAKKNIKD